MLFSTLTWLGIGVDYLLAAALIAGGGYVAFVLGASPINPLGRLLHYVGLVLIAAGILVGAVTYGKATGAADCEAAWKAKNYEAQIAVLKRDAAAKTLAAETAARQAEALSAQNLTLQGKVDDYADAAKSFSACRRATGDDDRRVCDILGAAAPGCANSR